MRGNYESAIINLKLINMLKKLELTVEESKSKCGVKDVKDVYFALTLVVDRNNNLRVFNTKDDGDWRDFVDCDTIIVKDIKLRP